MKVCFLTDDYEHFLQHRKQKIIIVFLELGVELQTEEMSVHSVGPLGLHPNNFLSPCKQCMILRSVQLWHGALLTLYVSFLFSSFIYTIKHCKSGLILLLLNFFAFWSNRFRDQYMFLSFCWLMLIFFSKMSNTVFMSTCMLIDRNIHG